MPELDDVTKRRIDDLVDEIVAQFEGTIERDVVAELMHDSIGRLAESAAIPDYLVPLAGRLTRERLRARRHGVDHVDGDTRHVVFVSLSGGGRGQLAAALTRRLSGGRVEVYSAGTEAHGEVDPSVAAVLGELGVDGSEAFARPITPEVLAGVDLVVTMGHSVGVFEIPDGTAHEDWRVGDPAGAPVDEVRRVCDDIDRRVRRLLERLGVPVAAQGAGAVPLG